MQQEALEEPALRQAALEELALLFALFSRQVALEELALCGRAIAELLGFFPERLRADKEVVLTAVRQYGLAVQHASQDLRADKDIALAAVQQDGNALEFLPAFQSDLEVVLEAVKKDHDAVLWASPVLQMDQLFALRAIRANELTLDLVSDGLGLFGDVREELQLAGASHLAAEGEFAPVLAIDSLCLVCQHNMQIMEVSGQKPIHRRICGPAVLVDSVLARKVWARSMAGVSICLWLPSVAVLGDAASSLAEEVGHERIFVTFADGGPMTPFDHRRPLTDFL